MIRLSGTREGVSCVTLVLEPENVRRMQAGDPILLDLQPLASEVVRAPLHLVIEAPADFETRKRELLRDAIDDKAPIKIIQRSGGVQ